MKIYSITLLLCVALLNAQSVFSKTPKAMVNDVSSLAEAAAVLNVCFESPAYKKLADEKALELHSLEIRLTDLVQKIAEHYSDDALYMTYEMMRVKMSSDPKLKEYGRKEYQYCDNKLFKEMSDYVSENERLINGYLTTQPSANDKGVWPSAAKRAYIDRCASSMESQGLGNDNAVAYCSCITGGMEKEFGKDEFDQMMKAQPNPSGSSYDKRLYKVFTSCSDILPR